ncbi:MAG: penicillin-binding protein [Bacteroidetes bacterium]|nr:penicillin-binding protein [Bacteroidota bacterium]
MKKKSDSLSPSVRFLWKVTLYSWIAFFLFILAINLGLFGKLPSLQELENPSMLSSSEIYGTDGSLMGKFYLKDRINVGYQDISKNVINALVATEDERFYQHSGIDPKSLLRAVIFLGQEGGASTLTQQLAKALLFGEGSRNMVMRVIQKFKEWVVAIKLERNFTKEEILTMYLNTVTYGDEIYGIRNAARTYFQKEPDRLAIEEAAVLVGLLKGSTRYNPRRNPKMALDRRNTVIDQLVRNQYIDANKAASLKIEPIRLKYRKLDENAGIAPYFREILREEMKKWCRQNKNPKTDIPYDIYKDGLKIFTTIDPRMQEYAEIAVFRHMQNLQKVFSNQKNIKDGSIWKSRDGKKVLEQAIRQSERWRNGKEEELTEEEIMEEMRMPVAMKVFAWNNKREKDTLMCPLDSIKYHLQTMQIGMLSVDPVTGEVKAWVGGSSFRHFKFDHVNVNTKRQVGSAFKPLLYTAAVMNGYRPETVLPDGPIPMGDKIITGTCGPMAICLAYSKNPAAVYLINQVGIERTIEIAKQSGITSYIPPYPSIALGSAEISLTEMVQAYSMFPGRGFNVKPRFINRIEDRNGNVLASFQSVRKEIVSEGDAYIMTRMMEGVVNFGTGRALRSVFGIKGDVGGKTGTTNDNADGWFIGFTPQLLTGVWVGCDAPFLRLLYTTGGAQMAMPAWAYYYQQVQADRALNYDTAIHFVIPETLDNIAVYDYQQLTTEDPPPAEGTDVGSGSSSDFIDVPVSDGREKIIGESTKPEMNAEEKKVLEEGRKTQGEGRNEEPLRKEPDRDSTDKKKRNGLLKRLIRKDRQE